MDGRHVSTIAVTINGETRRVPSPATLLQLLEHLGLDPRMIVVELNREIVRRPRLGETGVTEGDAIELVHFVGGG
jgi:thiamine biosynthesis protein ThiS